ncbi:MAG: hypothetical protein AAGE89_13880 [Pseudomonadota bacterium]
MKSTSLSVRVDDDDAAFLASMQIDGARTPSEKLRALLRIEQRRQKGTRDAEEATEMFRDSLRPTRRRIRKMEAETEMRSDFLKKVYDHLPEVAGAALAGPNEEDREKSGQLRALEKSAIDEVFDFMQDIIELGLSPKNRVYETDYFLERVEILFRYGELIDLSKKQYEEQK